MALPALLAQAAPYVLPYIAQFGGNAFGSWLANKNQQPNQPPSMANRKGNNKNSLKGNTLDQQGDWFNGSPGQQFQFPRFTPNQLSALDFFLQQGMQNSDFNNIENLARENFETKTIPSLAERFSGLASGRPGSSRFQGALGSAGRGLERDLAALRSQFGLQQSQLGLTPSFENVYLPGQQGAGAPLAAAGAESAVKSIPMLLQWLANSGYGKGQQQPMTPQQIRQSNIQQGYQPLPPPQPQPRIAPTPSIPRLGGLQ